MKVSELNTIIEVQTLGYSQDDAGGIDTEVLSTLSLFAKIEQLSGNASFGFQAKNITASHKITIRYNNNISKGNVVVFNNENYGINAIEIKEVGKARYTQLICQVLT